MSLVHRSVVGIDDLSNDEVEVIFALADEIATSMAEQFDLCRGKVLASLFFEPSTRTRLSFEAAMHRLGGRVISAVDVGATSLAKGESIADMARVVGSYADLIVIRHPWEGAARVVADYAGIPVINAGDGGHEHPTQTLCDLYTIQKERQTVKGLNIALWGDLRHGRTVHSLACALARLGATVLFRPVPGFEMPEHVLRKLTREYGGELVKLDALGRAASDRVFPLDAVYITPTSPHQLAMMPDVSAQVELRKGVDALYVTRLQKERHAREGQSETAHAGYPVVDRELLKQKQFARTLVMHPLPRVDELAHEMDGDPRSMYFKQAARGVPVRMALIALLLGVRQVEVGAEGRPGGGGEARGARGVGDVGGAEGTGEGGAGAGGRGGAVEGVGRAKAEGAGGAAGGIVGPKYPVYRRESGLCCPNPRCVSNQETEKRYIKPEFKIVDFQPLTLCCAYCDHELYPKYIASTHWHEGRIATKRYHSANSRWARTIRPDKLIIFDSEEEAEKWGFKPGRYRK